MLPGKCKKDTPMSRKSLLPKNWLWNCVGNHWILLSLEQCPTDNSQLTNTELLGLWMAVLWWMDNILFGRSPLWLKKVKINQLSWLHCILFSSSDGRMRWKEPRCLGFYWWLGGGQWSGHMLWQKGNGNQAYERDIHIGHSLMEIAVGIWGVQ